MPRTSSRFGSLALGLLALLAGIGAAAQGGVALTHVHGLAYSADGKQLMIPSHHGLALYENGRWARAPGPPHDYMGFSATAKHLFSSGHPAPGSGLVNPFGLIRSDDGGRTWNKLGLEGETDFHLLATSWNTDAVYVWNPAPSSRMKARGLHSTKNHGMAWPAARAQSLQGEPRALAVHPDDAGVVAVATSEGLYVSADSGARFAKAASGGEGLSAFFDLNGKDLWYGSFEGRAKLARMPIKGGPAVQVPLPPLTQDAVAYIAQNPARRLEYAIATFARSVYLSKDGGQSWTQIAERGQGR